ncbi:MerR family transcriptional regulator [Sphingorhabdus sp. 109]|jgi:DNA-binding transcriptional MerR regulator|uniref:MerR family transcriptional regulator n=1 Tax=Sphingorhabdus sp. 109 TaxID=2653173 RepID=UPI0012F45A2A|nr:helix-turn-helix domain-containing protein [Sphingorhabdus sp. 109]VWX61678.1 MerR family transcriptional regulator [Sphingorhabdus sp. 109]
MRIGELAKQTGTKVETIRYYESSGLLPEPARTQANYRDYDLSHMERLTFIRRSRALGFTLESVRELLRLADDSEDPCDAVDEVASAHLVAVDQKIADLTALREELSLMLQCCGDGTVGECKIVSALASPRLPGDAG